jgi:hypothetical protein
VPARLTLALGDVATTLNNESAATTSAPDSVDEAASAAVADAMFDRLVALSGEPDEEEAAHRLSVLSMLATASGGNAVPLVDCAIDDATMADTKFVMLSKIPAATTVPFRLSAATLEAHSATASRSAARMTAVTESGVLDALFSRPLAKLVSAVRPPCSVALLLDCSAVESEAVAVAA